MKLYWWYQPFGPGGRHQSFHFPTWLVDGDDSIWFEDFIVVDTYETFQLPLFLIE